MYRRGRHVDDGSGQSRSPVRRMDRNLGLGDRVPPAKVGAPALRETLLSPKGKFESPVNPDRVAAGRWRRTGLREVRPTQRRARRRGNHGVSG
jgi:hypothetical protein